LNLQKDNAMKQRAFAQVDVFTQVPYMGNPLAVVMDGAGLADAQMQHFAHWTNLSETTFVTATTQPSADYRIRIFTPGSELAFAGHPTLGTCHAWLAAGGKPRSSEFIIQQCEAGLVKIRRDGARLAFAAPTLKRSAPSPSVLARIAAALGLKASQVISAQTLDNGTAWTGLLLESPQTVLSLEPDHLELKKLGLKVGVVGVYPPGAESGIEVRAFAAAVGIPEDPVTGSLNASLAQWLITDGHLPASYVAAQGVCLGRAGRVHIERDEDGQVWVGGSSVTCVSGMVTL